MPSVCRSDSERGSGDRQVSAWRFRNVIKAGIDIKHRSAGDGAGTGDGGGEDRSGRLRRMHVMFTGMSDGCHLGSPSEVA